MQGAYQEQLSCSNAIHMQRCMAAYSCGVALGNDIVLLISFVGVERRSLDHSLLLWLWAHVIQQSLSAPSIPQGASWFYWVCLLLATTTKSADSANALHHT